MLDFIRRVLRSKKPEPEPEKKIKTAWLCIEMMKPDGTPTDYRELQITTHTQITWVNRSGFKVHLTVQIREEDDGKMKDPITASILPIEVNK
jgi:hypothetical protein